MSERTRTYTIGIAIPIAVGALSALLTRENMDVYSSIVRPSIAPLAVLFPIVWTALYILMGISSILIYDSNTGEKEKPGALFIYGLQLVVNFFWSILFFNQRAFLASFIWLLLLALLILFMISDFRKINKTAAWLQLPYLLWVIFAGYLNFMIWILNR